MKSFDFPQIFNPILASSKFLKIQNDSSLKKCTSELHTMSCSTLKLVNLQLFKQSSKNVRFPTEVDRQKSSEPLYHLQRDKNQSSGSRKVFYEVQKKKKTNKDQKLPDVRKRKMKKQRSRGGQKEEELNQRQLSPSNQLSTKNNKKDLNKNRVRISKIIQKNEDELSQSMVMIEDPDLKDECIIKSKKDFKSKKVLIKEEFDISGNRSRLETNKSLLSTRKQNNKKKKEKPSFFTGELAEDLIKQAILRRSKTKRTLTLQVINLRKGSIRKSSEEKYFSKQEIKNQSETSLQFQEQRRKKTSKNILSTRKRVAFMEEDEELKNRRRSRKKKMIKRKSKLITSIEHLIHDEDSEELINYRLNNHKNKKVALRKSKVKIQENIFAELNYFNMRLVDKPKELFDEEQNMKLPTNIPCTCVNGNLEAERLRRERFNRQSQMIDFAVRMGKGYLLKQVGIR